MKSSVSVAENSHSKKRHIIVRWTAVTISRDVITSLASGYRLTDRSVLAAKPLIAAIAYVVRNQIDGIKIKTPAMYVALLKKVISHGLRPF